MHVDGLLPIHRIEELEGGLPRANVGPSDHMGLMVRALPLASCASRSTASRDPELCASISKADVHQAELVW